MEKGRHSVPPPAGASVRNAPVPPLHVIQPEAITVHAKGNLAVGALEEGVTLLPSHITDSTPSLPI